MLLARLQRVHESARAVRVHGLTRDAAGHLTHERLAAREDAEVRAAIRHRDAERLALSDDDVSAEHTRRLEERARVRLGHLHAQRAGGVRRVGHLSNVDERPERVGVLHDEAGRAFGGRRELRGRHLDDLEPGPAAVRAKRAPVGEVHVRGHDHPVAPGDTDGHERRLGRGRAAVVHR